MADVSDVETQLVALVSQIVYPNGTGQPSVIGTAVKIYRGYPVPANLDKDLAAGVVNISVFPLQMEHNVTRYLRDWVDVPDAGPPALTVTAAAMAITLGGTVTSPLNVAAIVNGFGYVYAVQPGDTLASIATALAALINADTTATSSGAVVTIPAAHAVIARVGQVGTVIRELSRQNKLFQIKAWCPTPALRDAIVPPIDVALKRMTFIALPEGSAGRVLFQQDITSDRVEREGLYSRELRYWVEYPTTETQSAAEIVLQKLGLYGGLDPTAPLLKTINI